MSITIGLDEKYLQLIANGTKVWEGRLNNDKYGNIKVGDSVIAQSASNSITFLVQERRTYASFEAMLQDEGVNAFLPGDGLDLEDAVEVYRGFPGYREGEKKLGAVAFRVKVL